MKVDTSSLPADIARRCAEIGECWGEQEQELAEDEGRARGEWTSGQFCGEYPGEYERVAMDQLIDEAARKAWDIGWNTRGFEIHFDNGGGMVLQTDDYCHAYDKPGQLAEDVRALANGSDPRDWDGNQPEYRLAEAHAETKVVYWARVKLALNGVKQSNRGHAEEDFWRALILPPDPEGMNDARAGWAQMAIDQFEVTTRTDREDALCDLLADLRHWADREGGLNYWDTEIKRAMAAYAEETQEVDRA